MNVPKEKFPELDYILDVIFCSSLGMGRPKAAMSEHSLRLSYGGDDGIIINRPIITVANQLHHGCLSMASLPEEYASVIGETRIPVYRNNIEESGKPLIYEENGNIVFDFDILCSAFYILTRTEEIGSTELDKWGRFPASASHAYKNNYLHRPVVDEYAEVLWYCAKKLWPGIQRKERKFEMMLTHDVDEPFEALFKPAWRMVRSFVSDVLRKRDIRLAVDRAHRWIVTTHTTSTASWI